MTCLRVHLCGFERGGGVFTDIINIWAVTLLELDIISQIRESSAQWFSNDLDFF